MNKKELIEIIEGCVYNSQVLTEERVCFNELRKELNEELPEQLTLTDVSQRSKLYFAFMQEYNALMGKSEHQILKEEVIVLLAKYSG